MQREGNCVSLKAHVHFVQALLPETCRPGFYRAPGGCRSCVAGASPFTKLYGGV